MTVTFMHMLEIKLRSSWLCSKHFTNLAILPEYIQGNVAVDQDNFLICMCIYIIVCEFTFVWVPTKVRRGHWMPWNWRYMQL